jgi:hypothetical protein
MRVGEKLVSGAQRISLTCRPHRVLHTLTKDQQKQNHRGYQPVKEDLKARISGGHDSFHDWRLSNPAVAGSKVPRTVERFLAPDQAGLTGAWDHKKRKCRQL